MLTYNDLVLAERALRGQTVLTVYVNGEERDPSKRHLWRLDLRHALDDIERWLVGSSHAEREAFVACRKLADDRLNEFTGVVRAQGWVGFFTASGEHAAGPLPVATPTMAAWSTGPSLAPCVRVLKEGRPVIVAVLDSGSAKIYRYVNRSAELVDTIEAQATVDAERHMGRPPVAGFHVGTRGPTGHDRAQRELRDATSHMLANVADRLTTLAGRDGWILTGGIPSVALAALRRVKHGSAHRAAHIESLNVAASVADIEEAARDWAARLRNREDERRIDTILASSKSDGRGVNGVVGVLQALETGSVRELYFSPSFLSNHMADAESAVRAALATNAIVEQVSGIAAERLDRVGGIAARLRYSMAMPAATFAHDTVAR